MTQTEIHKILKELLNDTENLGKCLIISSKFKHTHVL